MKIFLKWYGVVFLLIAVLRLFVTRFKVANYFGGPQSNVTSIIIGTIAFATIGGILLHLSRKVQ